MTAAATPTQAPPATPSPSPFQKATKKQAKLRLAFEGPAGYGKTYSALTLATALAEPSQRIAAIDTEARSMSKYAHLFDFDVMELEPPFNPRRFVDAIRAAEEARNEDGSRIYGVIVVDSLSHAWAGAGGTLDMVDELAKTKYRGDSHSAWREGSEIQQELIDAILRSPLHVVAAMRTKADFVREEIERDGRTRTVIRKAGTKTIQRDEFDYEFDVVARFDTPAVATLIKSRVDTLPPETVVKKPGAEFAGTLKKWLAEGALDPERPAPPPRMSEETRKRVDALRMAVSSNKERKAQYEAATTLVQGYGFTAWRPFFEKGTEAQALEVEAALSATPKSVEPETPADPGNGEVKQPQLVA